MSKAIKMPPLGSSLYSLLDNRDADLKKYFLDPNSLDQLQDEVIRLRKEEEKKDCIISDLNKVVCNQEGIISDLKQVAYNLESIIKVYKDKEMLKEKIIIGYENNVKLKEKMAEDYSVLKDKITEVYEDKEMLKDKVNKDYSFLKEKITEDYEEKDVPKILEISQSVNKVKKDTHKTKTYLIKNRRNGFYKIGKSRNPKHREKTLQSEEPDILMVKTWDKDIERVLHKKYNNYRIRGEWFELSKTQVQFICTKF